jgi:uncharacterized membrane protein
MKSKRILSIDVMRVIALLLMIQTHFVEFLSPGNEPWAWLYDQLVWGIWGVAPAPLFLFASGLSFWLWLKQQRADGKAEREIVAAGIRRGLGIFIIGLIFVVTIWLPESLFAWDILTLIGAATLLLCALRKLPPTVLVVLAVVVVLISPPLRAWTGYADHWEEGEYLYEFTLSDVVWGFLSHAYFGLFPWLAFHLVGYAVGTYYFAEATDDRLRGWSLPIIGAALMAMAFVGKLLGDAIPGYTGDMTFYPAATTYMLATLGMCLVLLWGLYRLVDARDPAPGGPVMDVVRRYNRFALTTYFFHHAVHLWPIYILGLVQEGDVWWYYGDAVSTPVALLLSLVFIAAFYPVLSAWDQQGGTYSLEWFLRRFTARPQAATIPPGSTPPELESAA